MSIFLFAVSGLLPGDYEYFEEAGSFLKQGYTDPLYLWAPLKTYCRSGVPAFSRQIVQKFCRNTGVFQEIYVQYDG